jgi:single-stranded-DNA-specific exonuclease
MKITTRDVPPRTAWTLEQAGVSPLLARLYAARGVLTAAELDDALAQLLAPTDLLGIDAAATLLAQAIAEQRRLCIVADYDCDGATACAVGVRGLRSLGAQHVDYLVPDRVRDGYGLTAPLAERVAQTGAQVLITVDNGIASVDGVARAKALGLQVVVTDHHLCALNETGQAVLPQADAIVNPNQPGCGFGSKALAGVGVMFYVLLQLRSLLRAQGRFNAQTQPRLDALLPLVALGTVADVVKLDANNRRLVSQGLRRIRGGHMPAGMTALFHVAARDPRQASSQDFGFALGPRLNAAGRLSDMTLGIECLVTDDSARAVELAQQLDAINRERRAIEGDMKEQAIAIAEGMLAEDDTPPPAVCVFDPDFHEGVVGIVASRLKDKWHRPTFVFAASAANEEELKGSGRSIPGFHLRDALDWVAKRHPGVLLRFGGHAMAAGCTIHADALDEFEHALHTVAAEWLDPSALTRELYTDGALPPEHRSVATAELLAQPVWGQGFATPVFSETVNVVSQRVVGSGHLQLKIDHHGQTIDAIWFGRVESVPERTLLAFRLDINEFRGQRKLQFVVEGMAE